MEQQLCPIPPWLPGKCGGPGCVPPALCHELWGVRLLQAWEFPTAQGLLGECVHKEGKGVPALPEPPMAPDGHPPRSVPPLTCTSPLSSLPVYITPSCLLVGPLKG